jgi:hypothetical protein
LCHAAHVLQQQQQQQQQHPSNNISRMSAPLTPPEIVHPPPPQHGQEEAHCFRNIIATTLAHAIFKGQADSPPARVKASMSGVFLGSWSSRNSRCIILLQQTLSLPHGMQQLCRGLMNLLILTAMFCL